MEDLTASAMIFDATAIELDVAKGEASVPRVGICIL